MWQHRAGTLLSVSCCVPQCNRIAQPKGFHVRRCSCASCSADKDSIFVSETAVLVVYGCYMSGKLRGSRSGVSRVDVTLCRWVNSFHVSEGCSALHLHDRVFREEWSLPTLNNGAAPVQQC